MKWSITERSSESLEGHLNKLKRMQDSYDYQGQELYDFYGYMIPDESIMKNLDKAAERIIKGVRKREKLIIFGHDDLDGITSTYILFDFLNRIGSQEHFYYIPNRLQEHHGIQEKFIEKVRNEGYSLVVTVDGGITSNEGVEKLNELGCDTIITDHHIVPENLPPAYTIVNPKQSGCPYPYDMLAGVGVTFFLVKMLSEKLHTELPEKYLFWTAIGTIADKAPMTGVNRILCKIALQRWFDIEDETLMLLHNYNSVSEDYFSKISFINNVIKLLNNGREAEGENTALYLLLAPVYKKKELLSKLLRAKNEYEYGLSVVKKIVDNKLPENGVPYHIITDDEDEIPFNFLGWAANYITYIFKIPVLMIKRKNGNYLCEARCTEGFNLVKAFDYAHDFLDQYGGHIRAAGFLTSTDKIKGFLSRFNEFVESNREEIEKHRVLKIDAVIEDHELNSLAKILNSFAPYGEGANEPVFLIRNYRIERLLDNNYTILLKNYTQGEHYDIVFTVKPDGKFLILDFIRSEM